MFPELIHSFKEKVKLTTPKSFQAKLVETIYQTIGKILHTYE
jgi:hypothetical protein